MAPAPAPTADMTPAGVAELMLQEGTVLRWYRDATGTWTCCTGHTAAAGAPVYAAGQTFTRAEAAAILASDLRRIYLPGVDRLVTRPMLPHQRDAFGDFSFNAGLGNFAHSSMLARFNAGDAAGAAEGFAAWTRSKGVVLPGLVKRRAVEREMFLHGVYPGVTLAPDDTAAALKDHHTLLRGAEGDDVAELQRELGAAGWPTASSASRPGWRSTPPPFRARPDRRPGAPAVLPLLLSPSKRRRLMDLQSQIIAGARDAAAALADANGHIGTLTAERASQNARIKDLLSHQADLETELAALRAAASAVDAEAAGRALADLAGAVGELRAALPAKVPAENPAAPAAEPPSRPSAPAVVAPLIV